MREGGMAHHFRRERRGPHRRGREVMGRMAGRTLLGKHLLEEGSDLSKLGRDIGNVHIEIFVPLASDDGLGCLVLGFDF